MTSDDLQARRRARARWPVRLRRLGEGDLEPMPGSAAERLAATWELTLQAWSIAGRALPGYDRAHMPIRIVRLDEVYE